MGAFEGKVVIVTGADQGIGYAIAWFVGSKGAFMTGAEIVADGGNLTHL